MENFDTVVHRCPKHEGWLNPFQTANAVQYRFLSKGVLCNIVKVFFFPHSDLACL